MRTEKRLSTPTRVLPAVLCAALLAIAAVPSDALDLSEGLVRLTLHEENGRFSISCLKTPQDTVPVALLAAQDPRTTMLSIVVGTKIYRMGDNGEFLQAVQKTPAGGRFLWTSPFLSVSEEFSFVSSAGSAAADGVRIDITLKNLSRDNVTAGARLLLDTWLGETGPIQFFTSARPALKREASFSGRDLPAWWVSPLNGDPGQFGLQGMLSGPGITPPDRVVFANWKRLSDAAWGYDASASRDFSLQPYSINDSAVCLFYDPRPLAPGAQSTVTLVLGKYNPAGFSAESPARGAAEFTASVKQSMDAAKAARGTPALRADLEALDKILSRLDAALAPGGSATDDELSLMESAMADLEARLKASGTGQ